MNKFKVGQLAWLPRGNPQHPEVNRAEPVFVISDDGGDKVCGLMRTDTALLAGILGGSSEKVEFIPRELIYETKKECEGPGMEKAMKHVLELQEQGLAPMCDCDVHKRN